MTQPKQQVNYQSALQLCQGKLPQSLLGVLIFAGRKLEASVGSRLPTSPDGFPSASASQKIHAHSFNDQPCLIYCDTLPDDKRVCLIFPSQIRVASLREQAAQAMEVLRALSIPKTVGLSLHEEAVLAEFIQAAVSSRYARETDSQPQATRLSNPSAQPITNQDAVHALYWPYWFQIF